MAGRIGYARIPCLGVLAGGLALIAMATPCRAQDVRDGVIDIAVGRFESAKVCTVYQESAGSQYDTSASALAVGRNGLAAASTSASYSTWRTWLVKDCVDNFASLRTALGATLGGVGHGIEVVAPGRGLVLSGAISDLRNVGQGAVSYQNGGVVNGGQAVEVTFDIMLKDRLGHVVFGQTINKSIDTGRIVAADGFATANTVSGRGLYAAMEKEVALAAARMIAFHFHPIRVVEANGARITLNYGAPLLDTGDLVQVLTPRGSMARFHVTGSVGGRSVAELEGRQDLSGVGPGADVAFVDPSSPAANGRRFERVELP